MRETILNVESAVELCSGSYQVTVAVSCEPSWWEWICGERQHSETREYHTERGITWRTFPLLEQCPEDESDDLEDAWDRYRILESVYQDKRTTR
jgi:hypothetical protein